MHNKSITTKNLIVAYMDNQRLMPGWNYLQPGIKNPKY